MLPGGQVEKLTLEAEHLSDASVPPRDQANRGKPSWKPNAVAMWLPAGTVPTKACSCRHSLPHRPSLPAWSAVQVCHPMQVVLTGVPLGKGLLTLTGCRLTALGVTWKQPWSPLVGSAHASPSAGSQEAGGLAQVGWRSRAGHGLHAALQSHY